VSTSGTVIINNLCLSSIAFLNPFKPIILSEIDPQKSYISISDNINIDNKSILLSFFYNTQERINFHEPNCCERVVVDVDPNKSGTYRLGLQQKLDNKKIRRVEAVQTDKGTLLTLVTKNNLVFRNIPLQRFSNFFAGYDIASQLYLNDFDIDFELSYIYNVNGEFTTPIILNFYYYEYKISL
jgi:hypothetical protein